MCLFALLLGEEKHISLHEHTYDIVIIMSRLPSGPKHIITLFCFCTFAPQLQKPQTPPPSQKKRI